MDIFHIVVPAFYIAFGGLMTLVLLIPILMIVLPGRWLAYDLRNVVRDIRRIFGGLRGEGRWAKPVMPDPAAEIVTQERTLR